MVNVYFFDNSKISQLMGLGYKLTASLNVLQVKNYRNPYYKRENSYKDWKTMVGKKKKLFFYQYLSVILAACNWCCWDYNRDIASV